MSVDVNWDTLTGGPDGQELAHAIRDFVHNKFQSVTLPRFIKSVTVHDFEFGSVPPELELKDITDPLPEFYEENSDADIDDSDGSSSSGADTDNPSATASRRRLGVPAHISTGAARDPPTAAAAAAVTPDLGSPFLGMLTPGIHGGTSNLHYFAAQFATGLSGTQTPLAAVAGAQHLGNGRLDAMHGGASSSPDLRHAPPRGSFGGVDGQAPGHSRNPSQSEEGVPGLTPLRPQLREKHSVSTLAPTSAGGTRPPTRDTSALTGSAIHEDEDDEEGFGAMPPGGDGEEGFEEFGEQQHPRTRRRFREPKVEDMQAVFRIRYRGDVRLLLTADILLDYPMPSFVGIPVRLSITGLTFDGVGVVAHIRKRVHFCFLSPEDAVAAVGDGAEDAKDGAGSQGNTGKAPKMGGLLQEIRVESEIGQRDGGKQSLKNVGKVERFVLEQVRRIFEDEFVYPSFWTFLV